MDMNNKITLVVMAAGMGSRFGGLKQIQPVGKNGEVILDYSIYDAKAAGFDSVVFIISKRIEKDFREAVGKRIEKRIDTKYVFQEIENLLSGFEVPPDRQKPWGTGHAVLQCANTVNTPFAVINADDYYGQSTYRIIGDYLKTASGYNYCMAGFLLKNTLTENGTVARGICETENGYLKKVTERTKIKDMMYTTDEKTWIPLPEDSIASMNMWGFTQTIFPELESGFENFLKTAKDLAKEEYFLPYAVDGLIQNKKATVKVLKTDEKWYGVTYKNDMPYVREGIARLTERGLYEGL
jgi:UTP-glucose-1-phosphate uridylyltransferase